ncbi:Rid family hydrolase [Phytoactinopolyspora endophytica]|uniref:Rid family hydrolase n=1 Tax=Phytoactinopolyspora endophytica TaxID=1642495 RepID=UPI00101D2CAE|nr:Rid family hydrolase [Phytoactinopolyspora endophytica]
MSHKTSHTTSHKLHAQRLLRSGKVRVLLVALLSSLVTLGVAGAVSADLRTKPPRPNEVRFNLPSPEEAPDPFLAGGVSVGSGVPIYFSSGVGPAALNPDAPAGTPESYINPEQFPGGELPEGITLTEAQGMNAMLRIQENLESQGLSLTDVTSMRIYLQAPEGADRADYDGWNRAYRKWMANVDRVSGEVIEAYEPVEYANEVRPSRTNLEVATLPVAGWLIEIEVVATYPQGRRR